MNSPLVILLVNSIVATVLSSFHVIEEKLDLKPSFLSSNLAFSVSTGLLNVTAKVFAFTASTDFTFAAVTYVTSAE